MSDRGRILAVDDDPMTLFLLTEFLGGEFDVKTATSGEEALQLVYDYSPDIILLDIIMPGMDGYDVCSTIRMDDRLASIKVIFVSAKELLKDRLRGYEVGGEDFITKPLKQEELLAKIRVFLRLKQREDGRNAERDNENDDANVFEKITEYFNKIIYIKAQFPICEVHVNSKNDDAFIIKTSLKTLEENFNENFLFRVHRSYLVNPHKIVGLNKKGIQDYQIQLVDNEENIIFVPVGRKYHTILEKKFPKYFYF